MSTTSRKRKNSIKIHSNGETKKKQCIVLNNNDKETVENDDNISLIKITSGDVEVAVQPTETITTPKTRTTRAVKKDNGNSYNPAPFCSDEAAIEERQNCDYTIKITPELAKSGKCRAVRIYADGIYDMFHSGHARQLMQAKKAFPNVYLLVGICNDSLTNKMKGRTVMNETERYEAVRHCRYVDEIITDAPWQLTDDYLRANKIDFVAHDDIPYGAGGTDDIYLALKERGMFFATQRTEGISTTDVIARIIKDYDLYVRRNLARGYTRKDLNLSYVKEKQIKFEAKFDAVKDKSKEIFNKWESMSVNMVKDFLDFFGKDGRINNWIHDKRIQVAEAISPKSRMIMNYKEDIESDDDDDYYDDDDDNDDDSDKGHDFPSL